MTFHTSRYVSPAQQSRQYAYSNQYVGWYMYQELQILRTHKCYLVSLDFPHSDFGRPS